MNNRLTYVQGYKSMYFFLCDYEEAPSHEDLSSLLGDLLFIDHDDEVSTSDPASWSDWLDSIHAIFPQVTDFKKGQLTYL